MGFKQWIIYLTRRLFFPKSLRTMEWTMLRLVNKDRKAYGLGPLFMQEDLRQVARAHSKDMAKKDYFEHENLLGKDHADRLSDAQISDVISGENLAKIGGYAFPVHRAEKGLMNSPGHRANILNKNYNCVGIGVHRSEGKVHYFTQNFARRNLIFRSKPPTHIRIKKGLHLNFTVLGGLKIGVYRVLNENGLVKEQGFPLHKKHRRLNITFSSTGRHRVQIYTASSGSNTLQLSNEISLYVKRGWFG